jgi:riboflavin biosynthesis pyrimidine reductase
MAVRIVTDSSCDLTDEEVVKHGIEVVPLTIRFGEEELEDRTELAVDEFYAKLDAASVLPETAAPAPGKFEAAFRRQQEAGADAVVCINLSSDLSATMQSAQNAARAAGDLDVRVGGGPTIVRDFLAADLIDTLHVVQVPIVLGRGARLWDGLEGVDERSAIEAISSPSGVTHLTLTRR